MSTNSNLSNMSIPDEPTPDTLRQQLDIQWRDHWQVREQTWKALQMVALLLVGYIGSGLKVSDPLLIRAGGVVCMLAACFGMAVTIHHRKIQIKKFTFIYDLEERLGLHQEKLLSGVKPPQSFSYARIFDFRELANPTFI